MHRLRILSFILALSGISFLADCADIALNNYAFIFISDSVDHIPGPTSKSDEVTSLKKELQKNYSFKVQILSNPGKSGVFDKLDSLQGAGFNKFDQILIYFMGYGRYDDMTDANYIILNNTNDAPASNRISLENLKEKIDRIPCDHILVMADGYYVHSGPELQRKKENETTGQEIIVTRRARPRGRSRGGYKKFNTEISDDQIISRRLRGMTRIWVTPYYINESEYLDSRNNMSMGQAFLKALQLNNDLISYLDLENIIEKYFRPVRNREFGRNTTGSDFLFIRN